MPTLSSLPIDVASKVLSCLNADDLLMMRPSRLPRNFAHAFQTKAVWRCKHLAITCSRDVKRFMALVQQTKHCQRLSFAHSRISQDELKAVALLAVAVESLNADSSADLDDVTMAAILQKHGQHLKHLNLSNCQYLTNYTMVQVAQKCPNLHTLIISNCSFSPAALEALTESESLVRHLKVLDVSKCYLMDNAAILPLSKLVNLQRLSLRSLEWINSLAIPCIIENYTSLHELDIRNCEDFTKSGIDGMKSHLPGHVNVLENAKLIDDTPDSIRIYLMAIINSTTLVD